VYHHGFIIGNSLKEEARVHVRACTSEISVQVKSCKSHRNRSDEDRTRTCENGPLVSIWQKRSAAVQR